MAEKRSHSYRAEHDADQYPDHRNIAVRPLFDRDLGMAEDAECDPERSGDDSQGFHDAENASGRDSADSDKTHVAAINLHRRHVRDRNRGRIHGAAQMAADEPDQGNQHEVGEHPTGAQERRGAQSHDVAEAQDKADRIEAENHAGAIVEKPEHGQELKIYVLLPHLKGGDEEVVNSGDRGRLQKQPGLGTAFLSRDQDLGVGGRLGVGQQTVHVAHEIASQRNQKQHAETATRQADEDCLDGLGIDSQDVECGKSENRARDHRSGHAPDASDDDILEHAGAAPVHARQSDGEDGDRNRGLHHLADLQTRVSGRNREDDAKEYAATDGARGKLRRLGCSRDDWQVGFARLQRFVGVRRKRFGFDFGFNYGHGSSLRAVAKPEALYPAAREKGVTDLPMQSDKWRYALSASRANAFRTMLIRESTTAPQNAGQKPWTAKPETKFDANISMSALMTHQNMPRVRMVRGRVMIFKSSPSVAFTNPMTRAAISAAVKSRT